MNSTNEKTLNSMKEKICTNENEEDSRNEKNLKDNMKLYSDIDRVFRELETNDGVARGRKGCISVEETMNYDMLNYATVEDLRQIARYCELSSDSKVLDLGGGIGGPARFLAKEYGCRVYCTDLQIELVDACQDLTAMTSLEEFVFPLQMDICTVDLSRLQKYITDQCDVFISLLAILHIPYEARETFFSRAFQFVRPRGAFAIVDFYRRGSAFSPGVREKLKLEVAVSDGRLPSLEEYEDQLKRSVSGDRMFSDLTLVDKTATWTTFVTTRHTKFTNAKDRFIQMHGENVYEKLLSFYSTMVDIFHSGEVGGLVIFGRLR